MVLTVLLGGGVVVEDVRLVISQVVEKVRGGLGRGDATVDNEC